MIMRGLINVSYVQVIILVLHFTYFSLLHYECMCILIFEIFLPKQICFLSVPALTISDMSFLIQHLIIFYMFASFNVVLGFFKKKTTTMIALQLCRKKPVCFVNLHLNIVPAIFSQICYCLLI